MGEGISLHIESAVTNDNRATLDIAYHDDANDANEKLHDVSEPLGRLRVMIDMPSNGAPDWGDVG